MSTALLNVWITDLGDPCSVANDPGLPHAWVVAVSRCDGRLLNWSEGRFRFRSDDPWMAIPYHTPPGGTPGWWYESVPTRDGHVEIELPPGCYVVRATMHDWFVNGLLYGNWATERAVVQACCGKDVCATLYAPSAPACWVPLFEFVFPLLVRHEIVQEQHVKPALDALARALPPEAASHYEQAEFEWLRRAFERMGGDLPEDESKKKGR